MFTCWATWSPSYRLCWTLSWYISGDYQEGCFQPEQTSRWLWVVSCSNREGCSLDCTHVILKLSKDLLQLTTRFTIWWGNEWLRLYFHFQQSCGRKSQQPGDDWGIIASDKSTFSRHLTIKSSEHFKLIHMGILGFVLIFIHDIKGNN
jgi:hypothetical protein